MKLARPHHVQLEARQAEDPESDQLIRRRYCLFLFSLIIFGTLFVDKHNVFMTASLAVNCWFIELMYTKAA